jgi:prevent-host-death family protein
MEASVEPSGLYTMRELNQHTADVIKRVNETRKPAVITRHGHFVALITPLADVQVESAVLGAVVDELKRGESDTVYSSSEMAHRLAAEFGNGDEFHNSVSADGSRELFEDGASATSYVESLTVTNNRGEDVAIDVEALSAELDSVTEAAHDLAIPEMSKLAHALGVGRQHV